MSSHAWGGDRPGLAGKHHWGVGSVGIPAALIAAGGYLDASVDQSADPLAEYYAVFKGTPSGLVIEEAGEDGGIVANSPTTNAFYAIPFDLYRWGAPDGSSKITLTFGAPSAGTLSALTMTGGRSMTRGAISYTPPAGGSVVLAGSPMTGSRTMSSGAIAYSPPDTVPGSALADKVLAITLKSADKSLRPNVTGINWAWSDARGVITSSGSGLSSNASGQVSVPIRTALLSDGVGFLSLDNYTGGNPLDYFGFFGPVRVP